MGLQAEHCPFLGGRELLGLGFRLTGCVASMLKLEGSGLKI